MSESCQVGVGVIQSRSRSLPKSKSSHVGVFRSRSHPKSESESSGVGVGVFRSRSLPKSESSEVGVIPSRSRPKSESSGVGIGFGVVRSYPKSELSGICESEGDFERRRFQIYFDSGWHRSTSTKGGTSDSGFAGVRIGITITGVTSKLWVRSWSLLQWCIKMFKHWKKLKWHEQLYTVQKAITC